MLNFAGDHNLAVPLLEAVADFLPVEITMIEDIDPRLIDNMDDWQVLLALHQKGFPGMITLDDKMLSLPREMSVVHQTNLTLVVLEDAGQDPVRATGELLTSLGYIVNAYHADQPQIFRIPKRRMTPPVDAYDRITAIAHREGSTPQALYVRERLSDAERADPVLT